MTGVSEWRERGEVDVGLCLLTRWHLIDALF